LLLTRNTWVPKSVSWQCCTPGAKPCAIIPTYIA
jgi:hypothetical protein